MDPDEDPSVTAAIVNVICELGWRRPHDFLPLAPRLFELLVDGGNNWMAIKLIKLVCLSEIAAHSLVFYLHGQFATLTPLEPRLVKKLLPPLTNIIQTTPAMSLLYECINGIIQGGILGDDSHDTDEIATICVNKLRGMIMINGDANRRSLNPHTRPFTHANWSTVKYVALLAFNKIVVTHPDLVAQQEDVILECIDSSDITIRIQALDLVQGMVTADNLMSIVGRLMRQLKSSMPSNDDENLELNEQNIDSDDDSQVAISTQRKDQSHTLALPEDYRIDVVSRILYMSSKDNYSNITDFDWYIDVLIQLIRMVPVSRSTSDENPLSIKKSAGKAAQKVGDELRSVAVKVKAMTSTAVRAAEDILRQQIEDSPPGHSIQSEALQSVTWILGEYAVLITTSDETLNWLLQLLSRTNRPEIRISALHALAKVFSSITGNSAEPWTAERKSKISLLMARILHSIESLSLDPDLEVQERAVEFIELLKLTAEAAAGQAATTDEEHQDPPLLLTQAIPSLFNGWELNSVAAGAQLNVPVPSDLNLDKPIHQDLNKLLAQADVITVGTDESDDFESYYHQRPAPSSISSAAPAINRLTDPQDEYNSSYQQPTEDSYMDADIVARRKADRMERNKDDPFYIGAPQQDSAQTDNSIHNILQNSNGPDLDIDAIPIMQLDLEKSSPAPAPERPQPKPRKNIVIAADETLRGEGGPGRGDDSGNNSDGHANPKIRKAKHSLLQVDSSTIGSFSLEGTPTGGFDHEQQALEDAEMQRAVKEVERLRLEMQRANERIHVAQGVDAEGTVIKKKKKKKATPTGEGEGEEAGTSTVKKKKKKAKPQSGEDVQDATPADASAAVEVVSKKKKKKKKQPLAQIEDS